MKSNFDSTGPLDKFLKMPNMRLFVFLLLVLGSLGYQYWLATNTEPDEQFEHTQVSVRVRLPCLLEFNKPEADNPRPFVALHQLGVGLRKHQGIEERRIEVGRAPPIRVLATAGESFTLRSTATNESVGICTSRAQILAPGFDFQPTEKVQVVTLRPRESRELIWVVSPKVSGRHVIVLIGGETPRELKFEVVNLMGLSFAQASILSYLATAFAGLLAMPWFGSFISWLWKKRYLSRNTT